MTNFGCQLDHFWNQLNLSNWAHLWGISFFSTVSFVVRRFSLNPDRFVSGDPPYIRTTFFIVADKEEGHFCFVPACSHFYWQVCLSCFWGIPSGLWGPTSLKFQHILKNSQDNQLHEFLAFLLGDRQCQSFLASRLSLLSLVPLENHDQYIYYYFIFKANTQL